MRLCLQLGRELSQPWAGKLDPSHLPKGSDRPWVSGSAVVLLVLAAVLLVLALNSHQAVEYVLAVVAAAGGLNRVQRFASDR